MQSAILCWFRWMFSFGIAVVGFFWLQNVWPMCGYIGPLEEFGSHNLSFTCQMGMFQRSISRFNSPSISPKKHVKMRILLMWKMRQIPDLRQSWSMPVAKQGFPSPLFAAKTPIVSLYLPHELALDSGIWRSHESVWNAIGKCSPGFESTVDVNFFLIYCIRTPVINHARIYEDSSSMINLHEISQRYRISDKMANLVYVRFSNTPIRALYVTVSKVITVLLDPTRSPPVRWWCSWFRYLT